MTQLPAVELDCFDDAIVSKLASNTETMPRFLILYGSVRERSYSRFAAEEAGRLLTKMGAEVKTFNPSGLPLPDDALDSHPKQSSVPKAWQEFDDEGRMKPSPWYDRIVDVAEELFKIPLILKEHTSYLADRYSERKENHQELSARINQAKI